MSNIDKELLLCIFSLEQCNPEHGGESWGWQGKQMSTAANTV